MQDDRLKDEDGRLAALRRYEILDTSEEQPFQRVVELVQAILHVPAAAVTLIDSDRQWYKASRGISARSIPRNVALCNETIQHMQPMAVTDTLADGRFADNPMVTGAPHVRSYLGVPLTTPDGYNIGTLCAIDTEPRPFDGREAGILQKLAEIVVEQFELRQIAKLDALTGACRGAASSPRSKRNSCVPAAMTGPRRWWSSTSTASAPSTTATAIQQATRMLVSIANACMASMRKSDVFGRIGGEEFALLLPETEPEEAREAAERVRPPRRGHGRRDRGRGHQGDDQPRHRADPAVAEGAASWFAEADIALYEAKNFGRNRVVLGKPRRPASPADELDRQEQRLN